MPRLLLLFLLALPAFPVSKEILQLQRDIALLQDQVRGLQTSFDKQLAVSQELLNQNLAASRNLGNTLAVLQTAIQDQGKSLVAPVASVNTRVDTLASQMQALRDSIDDMNSRLGKLQQQLTDIKNIVSTMPTPGGGASGGAPPAGGPPAQAGVPPVSAETLFSNAMRDYQAGNFNIAGPEFSDYIKFFGATERASDAQYYLGEIFYQQNMYDQAVAAFDQVLERYPEGKHTSDAQYKKGMALVKEGQRDAGAREFREVIRKYPRTPAANLAAESLKDLGLRPAAPAKAVRKRG